jgi:hypothetical protein
MIARIPASISRKATRRVVFSFDCLSARAKNPGTYLPMDYPSVSSALRRSRAHDERRHRCESRALHLSES